MADRVRIYEVGPRDGLQNEAVAIPLGTKRAFIDRLVAAGLLEVEATSFVSPKASRPRVAASKAETTKVARPALPTDRGSLIALHQAARRQRDAAPLLSRERAEASFEIERIEVQIARVERAMDPPLG